MTDTKPQWKICDAPAGGCGNGRRKAVYTTEQNCYCGSEFRIARNQKRSPKDA